MDNEATGGFEVVLAAGAGPADGIARHAISKTFAGDLVATSRGEMLSAGDPRSGRAGYVAMERVEGTLAGRAGGFALRHGGTMADGAQALSVTVVPGSGTGALAGLAGEMEIMVADGRHRYRLRYRLP